MRHDQLAEREQHVGPFGQRDRTPAGEGLGGRGDGVTDHRGLSPLLDGLSFRV